MLPSRYNFTIGLLIYLLSYIKLSAIILLAPDKRSINIILTILISTPSERPANILKG